MSRPIHAHIHTQALRDNLLRMRLAAPDARVWAVVKAGAYGHGIARVFEGLRAADGFAVLDLQEAQTLRDLDWRGPVLLLEGAFEPRDLELCSRLDLWHVVHHEAQIDMLSRHKTQLAQRVYLKTNTGMNRLGFAPARFRSAWVRLNALPQVDEISLMTHFAHADDVQGVDAQMQVFKATSHDLPGERSLANSAAVLRHGTHPEVVADWVRPGIALYGSAPDHPLHDAAHWGLRPAMSLRSRLVGVQSLKAGDSVGYGGTFTASHDMPVGIVAQAQAFQTATSDLPGERCLSNSAAVLRQALHARQSRQSLPASDWVRTGIALYGGAPDFGQADASDTSLQAAMSLRSKVIATQQLQAGDTVGYGSSFVAQGPMRIGIVCCGYADGYPRSCGTGTPVLVDGQPSRTIGRVSMDMLAVDLPGLAGSGQGAEVTLWGYASSGALLPIDAVAQAGGTIAYELMCALAARVPVVADAVLPQAR